MAALFSFACAVLALICALWPGRPLVGAFFFYSFASGIALTIWHNP